MRIQLAQAAALTLPTPVWAQPATQTPGYCGHIWGSWGWTMMGPLLMIVFLGAIVLLVVVATRLFSQGESRPSALDILNERYARGEIDKAEFDQKKRDVGS